MKNYILILFVIAGTSIGFSQNQASDFTRQKSDQRRDPRSDLMNFVPNEVIVKFKDEVPMHAGTRMKVAGISSVDKVLQVYGVTSLEKLFLSEQKPLRARMMKSPQGKEMKITALDKIYKISVPPASTNNGAPTNIRQLIEELKAQPEVEYAEPNYIYSIDDMQPVGPILTAEDVKKLQSDNPNKTKASYLPNDPLYGQQWYIPAVKVDSVWQQTTGNSTQIIAILDTGVDWTHPDLKNKIWINPNPNTTPDADGVMNDIRGWDFVNNDNNPMDDNSHGTHVAGIAAAETNNGIGIAGICPKAKIMPIKVMTSKGSGDITTIVKGINYAANHGATVINMSFGSYSPSLTLETILQNALAKNILLVAAAGNDHYSIYDYVSYLPFASHPAALSYVFGVQSDGDYSNYDPDGPVISNVPQGYNYELKAPGEILSTVLNGNYRIYKGTSMAAPIISGALALYRSYYPDKTIEQVWSDFVHSSNNIVNVNEALFGTSRIPKLDLMSFAIEDVNNDCDNDGKADAGETLDLQIQVRNTGIPANGVYAKIKLSNDDNPLNLIIIRDSVFYGNIGTYLSLKNEMDPFKIKLSNECGNNSTVSLDVLMYNSNSEIVDTQKLFFKTYNGAEISGIMLKDTTFTKNKNWVITNSLRIAQGVTLTIEPGTSVEILQGIDNRGKVIAIGTPEEYISLKGYIGGDVKYKYVDIDLKGGSIQTNKMEHCNISNINELNIRHLSYCKIDNLTYGTLNSDTIFRCSYENIPRMCIYSQNLFFSENTLDNCDLNGEWISLFQDGGGKRFISYNLFNNISNRVVRYYPNNPSFFLGKPAFIWWADNTMPFISNSFITNNISTYFIGTSGGDDMQTVANQYWGTNDPIKIRKKYYDFVDNSVLPYLNFEPKLKTPSDSCQGHVWRILVNGKDAQDEVVDPLGVGKHRFDIYFNRQMNKNIIPQVSYGGKYPYTSTTINENGSWSDDGKIYTVYKTIKLTSSDGINQIHVAGAKQAGDWGWVIPVEDSRFKFIISATNSASLDFMATPGLGKVKLEWNNNDLEDGFGYNMYRMEQINDSTLSSPVMVNPTLITDTLYTDFSVTPNKKYYYYYKILRTNLVETDSSKVVSATPFTASKGDANGDLSVNVLDITSIVAYLLNNNPQPFIFEAADMNSDKTINVLDIVGVVNLVLNGQQKVKGVTMDQQAILYMENDTLFADANVPIVGIQFDINGISSIEDIQTLKVLDGFESGYSIRNDSLRLLYYSMSGKSIPAGNHIPLLVMKTGSKIVNAVFGGTNGSPIIVNFILTNIGNISKNMNQSIAELGQNYPNPLTGQTTIPIHIYEPVDEAIVRIVNMMGQEVEIIRMSNPYIGEHLLSWDSGQNKGLFVYMLEIMNNKQKQICPIKKMIVQ